MRRDHRSTAPPFFPRHHFKSTPPSSVLQTHGEVPQTRGPSCAAAAERVWNRGAQSPALPSPRAPARTRAPAGATPAHRHALIALLAGEMKRSGPVIVRGIHHSTFGNQEVDEGRLPCRTEGRHHGEGKRRGSPNPKCEATLFYPLSPSTPEVFFCLRNQTDIKSDSAGSGHFGVALGGDSAPVHLWAREVSGKEPSMPTEDSTVPQVIAWNITQPLKILTRRDVLICCQVKKAQCRTV